MKWVNLAVHPRFSWPNQSVEIPFEGKSIVLQPRTDELSCTVSIFDSAGTTFEDGGTTLGRFLSRLAWSKDGGIVELFIAGSNNPSRPGRLGLGTYGSSAWTAVEPWEFLYLPITTTAEADLALALFREGMSVNSVPFAFLSFFKILNIAYPTGPAQMAWINSNLSHIWYSPAKDRITELSKSENDLGNYLYVQGRCAVAHANGTPIVNPDSYVDKRRLQQDLPLMKEVAATFIEHELGILSDSSFCESLRNSKLSPPEFLKLVGASDGRAVYA